MNDTLDRFIGGALLLCFLLLIVFLALAIFAGEADPCTEVQSSGKTDTIYHLSGALRREDGSVAVWCVDGERR